MKKHMLFAMTVLLLLSGCQSANTPKKEAKPKPKKEAKKIEVDVFHNCTFTFDGDNKLAKMKTIHCEKKADGKLNEQQQKALDGISYIIRYGDQTYWENGDTFTLYANSSTNFSELQLHLLSDCEEFTVENLREMYMKPEDIPKQQLQELDAYMEAYVQSHVDELLKKNVCTIDTDQECSMQSYKRIKRTLFTKKGSNLNQVLYLYQLQGQTFRDLSDTGPGDWLKKDVYFSLAVDNLASDSIISEMEIKYKSVRTYTDEERKDASIEAMEKSIFYGEPGFVHSEDIE